MFVETKARICLVCYRDVTGRRNGYPVVCPCGVVYSPELWFEFDDDIWANIVGRNGYEVTQPIEGSAPVVTEVDR